MPNSQFKKQISLTMEQWDKLNILITQNTQEINKKLDTKLTGNTRKMLLEEREDNKAIKKELLH